MKMVFGDLLKMYDTQTFDVIVHGCNCFNMMGAGIAAQIAAQYPSAVEADNKTIIGDRRKLGKFTVGIEHGGLIINMYTQYHPGTVESSELYSNIKAGFTNLKTFIDNIKRNDVKIGIPLIGCGIAGGEWKTVEKIIDEIQFKNITCVNFETPNKTKKKIINDDGASISLFDF